LGIRKGVLTRALVFVRRTVFVTRTVAADFFFIAVFRSAFGADILLNEFEQASSPQGFSDDL